MSNSDLENADKRRHRVIRQIQTLKEHFNEFNDYSNFGLAQLKHRQTKLSELQAEFELVQNKIEDLDNSEEQYEIRKNIDNIICEVAARIAVIIASTENEQTSHSDHIENRQSKQYNGRHLKLPTIPIPSFDGKYDEWLTFKDTFYAMIDSNDNITSIEKFHHLRAALKGEAARVIQSLETTDANYTTAWELVQNRYQNRRLIVSTHVHHLFNLPSQTKETAEGLRQMLDTVLSHTRALGSLGQPVTQWDAILTHLIVSKVHPSTINEWENTQTDDTPPTMEQLSEFLRKRCLVLESVEAAGHSQGKVLNECRESDDRKRKWTKAFSSANSVPRERGESKMFKRNKKTLNEPRCDICNGNHWAYKCNQLIETTINERKKIIRNTKLCLNCIRPGHYARNCTSMNRCKTCNKKHHTLLHEQKENEHTVANTAHAASGDSTILLSTAIIRIAAADGKITTARALLDSGSMSNFMTRQLAEKLNLKKGKINTRISGIAGSSKYATSLVKTTIESAASNYKEEVTFIVLPEITDRLPTTRVSSTAIPATKQVQLADPDFRKPGHIDILLGIELFFQLLTDGKIMLSKSLMLQNTVFGWVAAGRISSIEPKLRDHHHSIQCLTTLQQDDDRKLGDQLRKFWELETVRGRQTNMKLNTICEMHYSKTVKRSTDGRYTVHLPLDEKIVQKIGDTRLMASRRFFALEKRFETNSKLKAEYTQFMKEYETLGHMHAEVKKPDDTFPEVFLPHHGVIRADSTTTKLRVVFDASAKSTTGVAINDAMSVGPTIQDDLFSILCRFRLHKFVITADIEKMYRQIKIHEPHRQLQKIIWRDQPSDPLKTFILNTITYGTASAPYLAIRTLKQLADDEEEKLPRAADILRRDFYVDDLLTGADNLTEALAIQAEISDICARGGFSLRKWCANHKNLLSRIPVKDRGTNHEFHESENQSIKALGVKWNPAKDLILYQVTAWVTPRLLTKRVVVSDMAQLFDPLGILGPIVIKAKIFVQALWRLNISWDMPLPASQTQHWFKYREDLHKLNNVTIPRHIVIDKSKAIELHVFCDASELAYGACIYIRSVDDTSKFKCKLLCAKSRVAPLKHTTIPRLELCAALLGARLTDKVKQAIQTTKLSNITFWSDSTVVLGWISAEAGSRSWKSFVANRVAEIHELTGGHQWLHVRTQENPADLISRGVTIDEFRESTLWPNGPNWLIRPNNEWPKREVLQKITLPEQRSTPHPSVFTSTNHSEDQMVLRYSSIDKLIRVTAYCLRFSKGYKNKEARPTTKEIDITEYRAARNVWIRKTQELLFPDEILSLKRDGFVKESSRLKRLHPFLDDAGIIRVGGRLQNAEIEYDEKHPIVLAPCKFVQLLINSEHRRLLHAGPSQMLASLRQTYWILRSRENVRKEVQACLRCFRWKTREALQLMGSLPSSRVTPAPAFYICGVDYAGPFNIRVGGRRSRKLDKAYVALFVCFATRAAHIELVSSLSTEAFLAALRRFIARRGKPAEINSDNGTNFVGADRALQRFISETKTKTSLQNEATHHGIKWRFIPAHAPHFGGLWEGGVKATKFHLRRVIGKHTLSFEELSTILTQIEAILNSRPISAASNDPEDFETLTPGHFLIGRPLTTFPEPVYVNQKSWAQRWHMTQSLVQHFWSRWSREYLHQLQQRTKWTRPQKNLDVGELVLVQNDNETPLQWKRGRILAVHPGKDGHVRVATVKTATGTLRRPIIRLCRLPLVEPDRETVSTPGGMSPQGVNNIAL